MWDLVLIIKPGTWAASFKNSGTFDYAISGKHTPDEGYVFAGITESYGAGGRDIMVHKIDSTSSISDLKECCPEYDDVTDILDVNSSFTVNVVDISGDITIGDITDIQTYHSSWNNDTPRDLIQKPVCP